MRRDLFELTKNIKREHLKENTFKKISTDDSYKFNKNFEKTTIDENECLDINEYVTFYYKLNSGCLTKDNCIKTNATIKYLIANDYTPQEIYKIITEVKFGEYLKPSDLPDRLWEDSLLKRDIYYYHNTLQIISPAPKWNPETNQVTSEELYIEMKIRYTITSLYNYYINTLRIDNDFLQTTRDIGAFKHLLGLYKMDKVEPIDVVLKLIDLASYDEDKITNPLQLQKYEAEAISYFHKIIPQAEYTGSNQIIWRKQ